MLNAQQRAALEVLYGPLLVRAGAGTGKTLLLTERVRMLACEGHAHLNQILVVTFTNKAASELKKRISKHLDTSGCWIGTFHSLCLRMLREEGRQLSVIDKPQQMQFLQTLGLSKSRAREAMEAIDLHKNTGHAIPDAETREAYRAYEEKKSEEGVLDYSDLLIEGLLLLEKPEMAEKYRKLFRFICVDECQDINRLQKDWLQKLLNEEKNIFCVGDEDQAIFGWRGSDTSLVEELGFAEDRIFKLERNYRSSDSILKVANFLIGHNGSQKTLTAENPEGPQVCFFEAADEREEVSFLLEALAGEGSGAILARTALTLKPFENAVRTLPASQRPAVLTLHSAKGLEFDKVALPGWEEGSLPHSLSITEGRVEEERRLAYVGITRAKRYLIISRARYRTGHYGGHFKPLPSRFLNELPPLLRVSNLQGKKA